MKYNRPKKYPGVRSIRLRNPVKVTWPVSNPRPRPRSGPTDECFEADAKWFSVMDGKLVRVTGEPADKPSYFIVEKDEGYMELRLYKLGNRYFFVQFYYSINKEFTSTMFDSKAAAMRRYEMGDITYPRSKRIRTGES